MLRNWALRYGPVPFTPASLFAASEKGAWYDPSDISTLFQDSAGTTPVTATGQPVGKMLDKSGRGNHAVQATAASRPIYTVAGAVSYLAVDGVDDGMTAAIDLSTTDKLTLWVGTRKLSDAAVAILMEFTTTGGNNGSFYVAAPNSVGPSYGWSTRGTVVGVSVTGAATYTAPISSVISAAYDNAGSGTGATAQIRPRVNGVAETNASGTSAGNYANDTLYLFRRAGLSLPFTGNFYGAIIRGAATTAPQIVSGEGYLNAKMGTIF